MTKPKRQRTVHVQIKDRESGWVYFTSIRVERKRIVLNATPGIVLPGATAIAAIESDPPMDRLEARALRLGQLLQARWFGTVTP